MEPPKELLARRSEPSVRAVLEAFWHRVEKSEGGCWLWTGHVIANGYGRVTIVGRRVLVHRLSWEIASGPIPTGTGYHGTCVLHRCDVRRCVNPAHLFLGTIADNIRDMDAKGRRTVLRGERHGCAKLTQEAVVAIRSSGESNRSMATRYGVGIGAIQDIKRGDTWSD